MFGWFRRAEHPPEDGYSRVRPNGPLRYPLVGETRAQPCSPGLGNHRDLLVKLRMFRGSTLPSSPRSSKNLLPSVASRRSWSAGQWQMRCSTSSCSSSSRQLRQNSFAGIPNREAITTMIQCPVTTPTKVLIEVLFNFSKAEVLVIFNAGLRCLLITQPCGFHGMPC